ncbi:MAG: hypothetical protein ACE5I1_06785 [bacterium]
MTDKEFDDLFEKITPPDFIPNEAKAQLGRELMNVSHFKKKYFWAPLLQPKIILGAVASLVVVALLFTVAFNPEQISAKDLVAQMEAAYDHTGLPGKVHYLRFVFSALDREPVEYEQWRDDAAQKLRIQQTKAESREICAHFICEDDRVFALENSPFRMQADPFQKNERLAVVPQDQPRRKRISVMIGATGDNRRTPDGQRIMQAYIINDAFDYDAFERQTPLEIIDKLRAKNGVRYLGSEIDTETGRKLKVLERRTNASSYSIKIEFKEKFYGKVCWFCERVYDDADIDSDSPFGEFLIKNKIEQQRQETPAIAIETVKVYAVDKKICETILTIRENGREVYRAEKRFLNDEYVAASPELFNPNMHGLVLQQ